MTNDFVVEGIKKAVEQQISQQIDTEIQNKVKEFADSLISRKDDYIAQVMKGIRVYHEQSDMDMCMNYRIIFDNRYEIKNMRGM